MLRTFARAFVAAFLPVVGDEDGGAPLSAPVNTVAPVVSGARGGTLSCTTGTWTGSPAPTFTYQWQAAATVGGGGSLANIAGATASTFDDSGAAPITSPYDVRCVVTPVSPVGPLTAANSNTLAAWTPLALGGTLNGWYDEREQTDAGAGALSAWGDQSTANNDMAQVTGGNRPLIGATINGLSSPTFATNDFVSDGISSAFIAAQAAHVFAVVKPSAITRVGTAAGWFAGHTILGDAGGSGGNWGLVFYEELGVDYAAMGVFTSASGKSARTAATVGSAVLLEGWYDGANVAVRAAGTAEVTAAATGNVLLTTAVAVGFGFTGSFLEGDVATVLVCDTKLAAADRGNARRYLSAKYAVTA